MTVSSSLPCLRTPVTFSLNSCSFLGRQLPKNLKQVFFKCLNLGKGLYSSFEEKEHYIYMYFLASLVKEKCIFKWTLAKDGVVVVVVGSLKGKLWSPNFPL